MGGVKYLWVELAIVLTTFILYGLGTAPDNNLWMTLKIRHNISFRLGGNVTRKEVTSFS